MVHRYFEVVDGEIGGIRMSWKELMPQVNYRVRARRPIAESENRVISQLYLPIIHANAYSLYMCMYHQLTPEQWYSGEYSHRYLMQILGLELRYILQAREQLEGVGLLATYQVKGEDTVEYFLQPPLTPTEFFQSDVLNFMLLNRIGQTAYRHIYKMYSLPLELRFSEEIEKENITKNFAQVFAGMKITEVVPQQESESKKLIAEMLKKDPLPSLSSRWKSEEAPDYTVDFDYLKREFPKEHHRILFSEQNMHLIKMYAFLYNLDAERVGMLLTDSYNKEEHFWDVARFLDVAKRSFRAQSVQTLSEGIDSNKASQQDNREQKLNRFKTTSPHVLLRDYQNGGQVSTADERLVDDLLNKTGLEYEVVNVLLDFVMLMKENQLPREYTMKIASSWKRKGFQSAEDAFSYALQEYQRKDPNRVYFKNKSRKKVPEYIWLQVERDRVEEKEMEKNQLESETDIAEIERLMEELKKMR